MTANRDLRSQVEEAEKMLTQIDVKRMPSYRIGYGDGVAEGEAEGEAVTRQAIVRQLLRRLDVLQVV